MTTKECGDRSNNTWEQQKTRVQQKRTKYCLDWWSCFYLDTWLHLIYNHQNNQVADLMSNKIYSSILLKKRVLAIRNSKPIIAKNKCPNLNYNWNNIRKFHHEFDKNKHSWNSYIKPWSCLKFKGVWLKTLS